MALPPLIPPLSPTPLWPRGQVKKVKLAGIHAPPTVGTAVITRGFKTELNGLRGTVTAVDQAAWQVTVGLEDGRAIRRVKWSNMLFLPPVGARVVTRSMKKEMNGRKGVVVSVDAARWLVGVQVDGEARPLNVHPGKLEMDLA